LICRMIITVMLLAYAAATIHLRGVESLSQLFSAASVVFTGEVTSVAQTGERTGVWYGEPVRLETFIAEVSVDREYKGPTNPASIAISFSRPSGTRCTVSKCETLQAGDDGLFFLKADNDGYHLLDPYVGRLPVSRLKSATAVSGIIGLESDIVAGFHDTDENRLLTNIELYGASEHASSPLFELLLTDRSDLVHAAANAALLKLGIHSRLKDAARVVELRTDDPRELLLQQEISSFISEIRDRAAVQVLLEFAHSRSDQLREAVVHALREMGSADAVPIFVQALDDHLDLIRYDAVLGLAAVEKNWQLAPSIDSFHEDESKYITAWKSWWLTTGRSLYR